MIHLKNITVIMTVIVIILVQEVFLQPNIFLLVIGPLLLITFIATDSGKKILQAVIPGMN
ncbi:hypothetical protein [Flexistipes sp.]|uniref:hypothetical protein n=1 Tax=Flexistipes sp. TaxID=3088135 RepID=UPI002E1B12A0|nr:hypothetical protein [Flexistipes sp.]